MTAVVPSEWSRVAAACAIGLVIGSAAAWAYAWTIVRAPTVVAGLAPVAFGALVAGSSVDASTRLGVTRARPITALAMATALYAYLASWVAWLWLELRAIGQPLPLATIAHPAVARDVLVLVYQNGTGFGGIPLGVRWAAEGVLVLGAAAATAGLVARARSRSA